MTCTTSDDKSCETPRRHGALWVLSLMVVIFVLLSYFSFIDERGQVVPDQISYKSFSADEGKRIFQAYNCMGCHTIVGNGAYFAPDLTEQYKYTGPAWLEAFLPAAASWPTAAAVRVHLATPEQLALAGVSSFEEYLEKYPGAAERIDRRAGKISHMPNLAFREGEVAKLIAFMKYSSAMNKEGWPPEVRTGSLENRLALAYGPAVLPMAAAVTSVAATTNTTNLVALGERLTAEYGCNACHATDTSRRIGPGWGDLFNSMVELADGSTVKADKTYLTEAILNPNTQLVAGYPAGLMPAYNNLIKPDELEAMVAYLASLSNVGNEL
ncbi:c-type cytochrome [Aliidiomarina quisquiliarum]|uniref:c-type cytochrome n=1 Tax=Aliidiomarina quisquiliarum TaxID=2938947 RepID=UPI00208EEEF4|nr:c-type cytochrome [Aliidiomarina quisquiliarum]MCO4320042.1 c-type cytochrome [Aliidiomarina quisquiliarum]